MEQQLEDLLKKLEEKGLKGRTSSKSHLKQALYDWRVEKNWQSNNAKVISVDDCGFAFITFTKREPRHCTIRHLFVLEDFRGQGYGKRLIDCIKQEMSKENITVMRFFADRPSISFYESLGFTWHGVSKTNLPFYYGDTKGNLIELPKSQTRFLKSSS